MLVGLHLSSSTLPLPSHLTLHLDDSLVFETTVERVIESKVESESSCLIFTLYFNIHIKIEGKDKGMRSEKVVKNLIAVVGRRWIVVSLTIIKEIHLDPSTNQLFYE